MKGRCKKSKSDNKKVARFFQNQISNEQEFVTSAHKLHKCRTLGQEISSNKFVSQVARKILTTHQVNRAEPW